MSFLVINKTLKTRTATNAKISVLVTCIEAIIYLLLYTLHDCPFKNKIFTQFQNFKHVKNVQTFNGMTWRKRDLNVNEEILKSFKKLATKFLQLYKPFISYSVPLLFSILSPSFTILSSVEWGFFCNRFTRDDTFWKLVPTIFSAYSRAHLHILFF